MSSTQRGEDTSSGPTLVLATRGPLYTMHDSVVFSNDGATVDMARKQSTKTSNITFSVNHHDSTKVVTAASTQLGAKVAGDGKQIVVYGCVCIYRWPATHVYMPALTSFFLAFPLGGNHFRIRTALIGITVALCVSPFLTVADKAIVESTNGSRTILRSGLDSIRCMAHNPVEYLRSPTFLLMTLVYGCTYATANSFKTLEEHSSYQRERSLQQGAQPSGIHVGKVGVFLGTTFVNSGTSMIKDRAYARMFSKTAASTQASSFPRSTYSMWMMRDLSVIGSSFILPDIVSQHLVENYDVDRSRAQYMCQLGLPVAAQLVAGPFHYLGLDMFNRNLDHKSMSQALIDRSQKLYHGIVPVIMARVARIAPGYGIGGVLNTKWRTAWREYLIEQEVRAMMTNQNTHHGGKGGNASTDYATRLVALLYRSN
jgi:hypothetical protein